MSANLQAADFLQDEQACEQLIEAAADTLWQQHTQKYQGDYFVAAMASRVPGPVLDHDPAPSVRFLPPVSGLISEAKQNSMSDSRVAPQPVSLRISRTSQLPVRVTLSRTAPQPASMCSAE